MIKNKSFDIMNISDDYIAIPIGEEATAFHGVVSLSEAAAYLLQLMNEPRTLDELIDLLQKEYEVDRDTAEKDIKCILEKFAEMNLVLDS